MRPCPCPSWAGRGSIFNSKANLARHEILFLTGCLPAAIQIILKRELVSFRSAPPASVNHALLRQQPLSELGLCRTREEAMPKGLAPFGVTRQPIILLGLLLFVSGGHIAFRPLNNRYADTVALFQALCGDWRNRS